MAPTTYDKHYQWPNLFGEPYPELMAFFEGQGTRGKLLDLGCGQGRDAIALAKLGYEVTGVDLSQVGIDQMNALVASEKLSLRGIVADIYDFGDLGSFDFILLDSMFHFLKKDRRKEIGLLTKVLTGSKKGAVIVICIQNNGKKIQILSNAINTQTSFCVLTDSDFQYRFEDQKTGHRSISDYKMIAIEKQC